MITNVVNEVKIECLKLNSISIKAYNWIKSYAYRIVFGLSKEAA